AENKDGSGPVTRAQNIVAPPKKRQFVNKSNETSERISYPLNNRTMEPAEFTRENNVLSKFARSKRPLACNVYSKTLARLTTSKVIPEIRNADTAMDRS